MNLKTRNRLYLIFFIFSLSLFVTTAFFVIFALINHSFIIPENPVRLFEISDKGFLFKHNFTSVIISLLVFSFAVPIISFFIYKGFEKTPCLEVFFFLGFLIGCLCEEIRFFIPIFGLWKTYSLPLVIVGKSVMGGRILAPLSLLFCAVFSIPEQRQYAERNFLVMILVSAILAVLFPLDTRYTTTTCTVMWGLSSFFFAFRILIFVATLSVYLVEAFIKKQSDSTRIAISYTILYAGYYLLCAADCYIYMILGSLAFAIGSVRYLRITHTIYMWK